MTIPEIAGATCRTPSIAPDAAPALSPEQPPAVVPGAGPEPPDPSQYPLQPDEPIRLELDDRSSPDGLRSRLLTLPEAAAVFRRRPRTLRGWVKDGRLSLVRIGAAKFVSTDQIERLLGRFDAN